MIEIKDLVKVYKTSKTETIALNKLSLTVSEGEFVSVMGPSGCGKSTLMNILGMLDKADSGVFSFMGEQVQGYSEAKLTLLRKKNLGFIFQNFNLIDELTVAENIELPLRYLGVNAAGRKARVENLLERMQLSHRKGNYPNQLSGGQQQRVAVARALVNNPRLLLADEPTGNLDSATRIEVMNLIKEINKEGTTVIMVTHSDHDAGFSDRIVKVLDGQVQN
jgi:putative ABC transport system ATP-binding protein